MTQDVALLGVAGERSPLSARALCMLFAILSLLTSACARQLVPSSPIGLAAGHPVALEGFGACDEPEHKLLRLDPERPLVVLVHGQHSRGQAFHALSQVFALHDNQTVCYRYDDRESLIVSADRLRHGLALLSRVLQHPEVLVFGHSQGGLVARAALTVSAGQRNPHVALHDGSYRLVTVSTPFGGIRAARTCGSIPYHIITLGMSAVICRSISGAKWTQIHPASRMVRWPAALDPMVREHLSIITDERDTCRRHEPNGARCLQDDYVFSQAEQHNAVIERDKRVVQRPLQAGHVEVLGGAGQPTKLLDLLQRRGLLRKLRAEEHPTGVTLTARHGW